jgi:hypothetical protein
MAATRGGACQTWTAEAASKAQPRCMALEQDRTERKDSIKPSMSPIPGIPGRPRDDGGPGHWAPCFLPSYGTPVLLKDGRGGRRTGEEDSGSGGPAGGGADPD